MVYVADYFNHVIRKVTSGGVVTTLAGLAGSCGHVNATAGAARFCYPSDVAVDGAGTVYVADDSTHTVRKISPAGVVTTLARAPSSPGNVDATGVVYVTANHAVRRITPEGGVTTLAGLSGTSGAVDATGSAARFNIPSGLAVDAAGTLYIADSQNHKVRIVTAAGVVSTLAGSSSGVADGVGTAAMFARPYDVALDPGGWLYVVDSSGHTLRRVTLAGAVTTMAGRAYQSAVTDGVGGTARFASPQGVAVGPSGQVYITDSSGATIPTLSTARLTANPTAPPVGSFETPAQGATGVQGSIAVTGWAVDDVDVARVEIWRDVAAGETTPPFQSPGHPGHGKVFIANGLFVEGARPDIEVAFWDRPQATRAGWGYLLLTWGLWAQGNGSYTLHAFAVDQKGRYAALGAKTIAVSNATATKPFGGIDVPSYGQVMTGSFQHFRWALTPSATCTITPGNALVSIDSGPLVPVTYGGARTDIAGAFPGFSNGTNAGGAYFLNTAGLAAGTHTIGWLVTDNCGRADGIGSRFFTVLHAGGDTAVPAASPAPLADGPEAVGAGRLAEDTIGLRRNLGALEWLAPPAGGRVVPVDQDERIEVHLPARAGAYAGSLIANGTRRQLPVGSSLDAARGIFYWQPAPGFLGNYELEFAAPGFEATRIRVVVGPTVRVAIDAPAGGSVGVPFRVAGWALDLAATDGAGIDALHVWAYPLDGRDPIFAGHATFGGARPDVAAVYGPAFERSAFDLRVTDLPPGAYDLVVYPHRAATASFDGAQSVRVLVQ